MSNVQVLALILTSIALAQSALSANILIGRNGFQDMRTPLIVFFLANAVAEISSMPGYFEFKSTSLRHAVNLSGIPATLLLAPAIWFYITALTSEQPIKLRWYHSLHLIPFMLGICVCGAMAFVSADVLDQLIGDGQREDSSAVFVATALLVGITLINIGQLLSYMPPTFLRLVRYWACLKDLYANTHRRDLIWVIWMLGLLLINVLWVFYATFFEIPSEQEIMGEVANVALIWMLSVWGLEQLPGLRADIPAIEQTAIDNSAEEKPKYERSALSDDQIDRIAVKIERAMAADRLYMDPNLSLRDLAAHITAYPNYVSQTLNGKLNCTFFDFVNGWRIREAMPRLVASDEQVTNIAYDVGFNSRSSFYNAFKKETGETPTQYRKRLTN